MAQGGLISFLPLVLLFVLMYFIMIRPQMKRQKEHRQLLDGLSKGDEVITNGGIAGKVSSLGDSFVELEIATGVIIKIQKPAITTVLPKGSLK